jgi:hypothetical protein
MFRNIALDLVADWTRGRRESYRQCPCGLIFSLANREPDARFCCPGHARRFTGSESVGEGRSLLRGGFVSIQMVNVALSSAIFWSSTAHDFTFL